MMKAAETDQSFGKFSKHGARNLAKPIIELCNLSITLRSFPVAAKIALVKSLFKKCSKKDPSHYRLISLLLFIPASHLTIADLLFLIKRLQVAKIILSCK